MAKKETRHSELVSESQNIEAPYELPDGWKWTRLGDVADFIGGGTPDKSNPNYWNGIIPWASVKDIKGNFLFSTEDSITETGLKESAANLCDENGLILVTRIAPGKAIISKIKTAINQDLKIVKTDENKLFLKCFFDFYEDEIKNLSSGTTVKGIKLDVLEKIPFPLPPTLDEQQRIVSRIESMFTKLDEAKDKAQSVVDGFELRRAAILHKAFTGELTAKWRKENGVKDDSWEEKTLGDICSEIRIGPFGSLLHEDDYIEDGIPLVNPKHISNQRISPDKKVSVSSEKAEELKSYKLKNNDIVLGRRGEMGRCAPISDNENGWLCGTGSMILRLKPEYHAPIYSILISSHKSVVYFEENAVGSTLKNLNEKIVRNLPLPLIPFPEQQEIVRILDSVLEKDRTAKEAAEQVLEQIDLLKKSILARAFRGKL